MAGLLTLASCDDVNKMNPASGNLTYDQVQEAKELVPARAEASFSAMFTMMGFLTVSLTVPLPVLTTSDLS
jgi:hypothetical protein